MKSYLLLLVIMLFLAGCESLDRKSLMEQPTQKDTSSELEALFTQPYIDPLTRYLEANQGNTALNDELRQVRQERDRRCKVIADRFSEQAVTAESVDRFRRGYAYSCPQAVQAYANQLELQDTPAQPAPEQRPEPSRTQPPEQTKPHPQSSECYLLTSIKNYADAIRICDAPARSGDLRAQTNLANIHYELKRYDSALHWAKQAAESSADAAFILARLYELGQGVESDQQEALSWYQYAQQMGHHQAGAEGLRLSRELQ